MTIRTMFMLSVLTLAACTGAGHQVREPERALPNPDIRWPPAQEPVVASALVQTAAVPRGTVQGIVLHAYLGTPLENARVTIDGTAVGVVSGPGGLFRLPAVAGTRRLRVEMIGFERFLADLDFDAVEGVAARVVLTPGRVCIACITVSQIPTVSVAVRDALTGVAPQAELQLEIREESYRTVARTRPAPGDSVARLSVGPWRPGHYRVAVSGPDYTPWQSEAVVVGEDECGCAAPEHFSIWLLPAGKPIVPDSITG